MKAVRKVLILIEISFGYGRDIVRGIGRYSRIYGPWVLYTEQPNYRKSAITQSWIKNHGIEGLIIHMSGEELYKELDNTGLPTIIFAGTHELVPGQYHVISDDDAIGEMGAKHLLERGFRHFAFSGFEGLFWSANRKKSFSKIITEAGFKVSIFDQPRTNLRYVVDDEMPLMIDWLKQLPKPVALMACNDDNAHMVLEASRIAGLHIPEEIAVVGVDNDELICEISSPPLSSIAINAELASYHAAELLDKLMSKQKVARETIVIHPTRVETRQSTDILAIEDQHVAMAMSFMRKNARERIFVDDVANAVALSRRVLEKKFRKLLDCSINDEIRRVRINQACDMIAQTNIPIEQIALKLNFTDSRDLIRNFKSEMDMTPSEYRKKHGLPSGS
jgi:LacI family transcriptional regulator